MASSLHQNSTFLKPHHCSQSPKPSTSTTTRRSYIPVRCGGPRSQRGPLVRGRFLSIEAIQAIQTLKRIHRTKPQDQTKLLTKTLTRLIKSDLVATLKELLRQQQCTLALDVFSAVRSEYGADLSLYAEMVQALGICGMVEDVDRLIEEIVGEGGIGIGCGDDQGKGLLNLIKAVIGAKRRESTVRIYEMMKENGWGESVEPDEYVVKVLSNGFKGFGDEELAQQILNDYDRFCKTKFDTFRV
ncbi:protein THYLAKOID ASSEMBLY 8, chloroplastic-like [Trifolium pratense]|uniref:protein THYLAKOID ASSEMBLY 8, chloroplastic-like n=1 Tax=Trifolium pratense TaxID=57577 RepID=UPI001E690B34|nr:protein THYLAKOID ASSEMBLY 8, chloroplastic-like [Trifolium pratense]